MRFASRYPAANADVFSRSSSRLAHMAGTTQETGGIGGLAQRANPAFAAGAVAVPILALAGALASGDPRVLVYVHVMAGVLWTGTDLFIGLVLGPVVGGLDPQERGSFFARFTIVALMVGLGGLAA
jgi:hypothetical protein